MELVKHHNDINKLKLGTLKDRELNIFISILFKLKNKGINIITIGFRELLELEKASNEDSKRLVAAIKRMNKKLLAIDYTIEENGVITQFNIFNTFVTDTNNKTLKVSINENFEYMLNGLLGNFTTYSLKEYVSLKSSYSKMAYKLLKQFRTKSERYITLEEFKEVLGVPKSYSNANFNDRVIKPILKELTLIFPNLELIKLTKNNEIVRRGKKTHSLKFKWDIELKEKKSLLQNIKTKQDRAIIEANEKAKLKIEKQEKERKLKRKETNTTKTLSEIEIIKGNIAKWCFKYKKIEIFSEVENLNTLDDLNNFMIRNKIQLD